MENIVIAIISGIVAVLVAAIGVYRKSSKIASEENPTISEPLAEHNEKLIITLNATVKAQTEQIDILRGIVDEQRKELEDRDREIKELMLRVSNLERLTIEQALVIKELERSKANRRVRHEGGENTEHE